MWWSTRNLLCQWLLILIIVGLITIISILFSLEHHTDQYHSKTGYGSLINNGASSMPINFIKQGNLSQIVKRYSFHSGFDSSAGNFKHINYSDVSQLMKECSLIDECVGFNTNGYLKNTLLPFEEWVSITHSTVLSSTYKQGSGQGIYTLADIDYCNVMECRNNAELCHNHKGYYTCNKTNSNEETIQLVVIVDESMLPGLLPMLLSVTEHTIGNLVIHVLTSEENLMNTQKKTQCGLMLPDNVKVNISLYEIPEEINHLIVVRRKKLKYLTNTANFARLVLDRLFPFLDHVLYIDVDTIIMHDLKELWNEVISSPNLLTAVPRSLRIRLEFNRAVLPLYKRRYGRQMDLSASAFNAGVLGINLKKWRDINCYKEILYWMSENKKRALWIFGTQPLLIILSYNDWKKVDSQWNVENLSIRRKTAFIVHWKGPHKPWQKQRVRGYEIWSKYGNRSSLCNGEGTCVVKNNEHQPHCM